jgi:hypothetical protein
MQIHGSCSKLVTHFVLNWNVIRPSFNLVPTPGWWRLWWMIPIHPLPCTLSRYFWFYHFTDIRSNRPIVNVALINNRTTIFVRKFLLLIYSKITPKIPWDQKLVDCYLGSLCEEKYFFFNFLFWTSDLHISQVFCEHQAHPIPTPYEPVVNFCWKRVLSSFFLCFMRSSFMHPCG